MTPLPEVTAKSSGNEYPSAVPARKGGVRRLNPLEMPGWDKSVMSHAAASCFHSAGWARVLRDTYRHSPCYFGVLDGERLSALLPLMEVNSPLTGKRGVCLPFTDECPILCDDSVSAEDILREAMDFGRRRKWRYLEWKGSHSRSAPPSLSFFGHTLELSDRPDRIFMRFDSAVRRAIRKAENAGVQVAISQSWESLQTFYSLHCKTRKKHGLPPQGTAFFRSIFDHVLSEGNGFVAVASCQDRPIAAAVFFHFDDKALYKFGASDLEFQHLRGNNLILWEAIKWYATRDYASVHFGRTSVANEGLRRFKLGFGADEHKIDYFKYDFQRGAFVTERDRAFGWFNGIFRLLPIPLSRIVGMLLYRHLS